MAIGFFTGSGGGVDTSEVTATAEDVLASKVIVDANGNPLTGTMPNNGAISQTLAINGSYNIPQGYHNGEGKVTQSIATMGAQSITPKGSAQTIACNGKYMTGNVTVNAASNMYKLVSGTTTAIWTEKVVFPVKDSDSTSYADIHGIPYWTLSLSGFKSIYKIFYLTKGTTSNVLYSNRLFGATSASDVDDVDGSGGKFSGCLLSTTYIRLPALYYAVKSEWESKPGVTVYYRIYGYAS